MIVPVVIYNVLVLGGATWHVTLGHALISGALLMLFFELIKSTGIGRTSDL